MMVKIVYKYLQFTQQARHTAFIGVDEHNNNNNNNNNNK